MIGLVAKNIKIVYNYYVKLLVKEVVIMIFAPIRLDVRKRAMLPIVEVRAIGQIAPAFWIKFPLEIIEKAEGQGARLLPEEPKERLAVHTVYFTLIFKEEQDAVDFIKSLQHR